ncbi:MAG: hypothetical protein Q8Q42_02375 [Nanoarchaeota archaeon]|nr:hypothetical protein [Nanoarchaeota archaeon]
MKTKIGALMVIALFVLSIIPAVFAENEAERVEPSKIDEEYTNAYAVEKKAPIKIKAKNIKKVNGQLSAVSVEGGVANFHRLDAQAIANRKMALKATLVNSKSEVKFDYLELRKIDDQSQFDEGMQERAKNIVEHLLNSIESIMLELDAIESRIDADKDAQKRFPGYKKRIAEAKEKWSELYARLSGYIDDNVVTHDEWGQTQQDIKKFKSHANNHYKNMGDLKQWIHTDRTNEISKKLNNKLSTITAYLISRHKSVEAEARIKDIKSSIVRLEDEDLSNDQEAVIEIQKALK